MTIIPVDEELNEKLVSGKGLDPNYFSTKNIFQYYEISDFKHLPENDFKTTLDDFIIKQYAFADVSKSDEFIIRFYKKKILTDYGDHVYEAARDDESGSIWEHQDNLAAMIWLSALDKGNKKVVRRLIRYEEHSIFSEDSTISDKTDTITFIK